MTTEETTVAEEIMIEETTAAEEIMTEEIADLQFRHLEAPTQKPQRSNKGKGKDEHKEKRLPP